MVKSNTIDNIIDISVQVNSNSSKDVSTLAEVIEFPRIIESNDYKPTNYISDECVKETKIVFGNVICSTYFGTYDQITLPDDDLPYDTTYSGLKYD